MGREKCACNQRIPWGDRGGGAEGTTVLNQMGKQVGGRERVLVGVWRRENSGRGV